MSKHVRKLDARSSRGGNPGNVHKNTQDRAMQRQLVSVFEARTRPNLLNHNIALHLSSSGATPRD